MSRNARVWLMIVLILLAGSIPVTVYRMQGGSLVAGTASLPSRDLSLIEQRAQAFAGLVVKPIYMMLSLIIIFALIGQSHPMLLALQGGQIAFLAGEVFCAINFYIYHHESIFSEYLHSYGMALAFGFTAFAWIEGRKSQFENRFILTLLAVSCFIPMLAPIQPESYAVSIFRYPYSYTRLDVYQIYERRFLPALALLSFIGAHLLLLKKHPFTTHVLISAGLGALIFSYFRLTLNTLFADNLIWFEFWEEAMELIFVGTIGFWLWRFNRHLLEKTPMFEWLFPNGNSH